MRRAFRIAGWSLCALVALLGLGLAYLQTGSGRALLIEKIEAAASTPEGILEIGSIEGFVPFDFVIRDIAMSDRDGAWLRLGWVDLGWSPSALLGGTLEIDRIVVDRIDLARAPVAQDEVAAEVEVPAESEPFTWPSLPVAIDLHHLSVGEIALGAPLLGEAATFRAAAAAKIGDVADGVTLKFNLERLDGGTDIIDADIAFVPATDHLTLAISVQEPRGGLITKALGLVGAPDFRVEASGDGALSDWQGDLGAILNGESLADIVVQVTGTADRNLHLQAQLAPSPLLPPNLQPLLAQGLRIATDLGQPAGGDVIEIHALTVESEAANISVQGRAGLREDSDLTFSITADDAEVFAGLLPDIRWQNVTLEGRVTGTWPALDLTATTATQDLAAMGNRIARADLALTLSGDDVQAAPVMFDLLLDAAGIDLGTAEANAILADGVTLGASGSFDLGGTIDLESLDAAAGPVSLTGSAAAEKWGDRLTADVTLTAPDLAQIKAAGAMKLAGALTADLDLSLDGAAITLDLTAAAERLATGIGQVDGLLGASPKIVAAISRSEDGSIEVKAFDLTARAVTADAKGSITPDQAALTANINLSDLGAVEPGAAGALAVKAVVDGTLAAPHLRADLSSSRLAFGAFESRDLMLAIDANDLMTAPRASVTGSAVVADQAARLRLAVLTEAASGAIRLDNLALQHGPSAVSGNIRLLGGVAEGGLKLAIADLSPYAPLLQSELAGSVLGDVQLRNRNGQQDVALDLTAADLAVAEALRIGSLKLVASVSDAAGTQAIEARADVAAIVTPQVQFDTLALAANGNAADLDITLGANGPEASVDLVGDVSRDAETIIATLTTLSATIRGETLALRQPARITQAGETLEVAGFDLGYRDGGVVLEGSLGPASNNLQLRVNQLSLEFLRMIDPTQDVAGLITGTASLSGNHAAPIGTIDLAAENVTLGKGAGVTVSMGLQGNWQNALLQANSKMAFSTGGELALDATLGVPADPVSGLPQVTDNAPLQAKVSGDLDLALANRFIAGGADRIGGKMRLDLAADGTLGSPQASGSAVLSEGRYDNLRYGIKLRQWAMELRGNGDRLDVVSLSARTPGKGQISGQGGISLEGDMPVDVALTLNRAQVINTDLAFAIVDAQLRLAGTAQEELSLTGQVTVPKSEIRIPDRLPASVQEIAFVEVNAPPERAQKIEAEKAPPAKTVAVNLDIAIDIPQQMAIRGRGLDAEMGGKLQVAGTADVPIVTGAVDMRRGTLDLVGRRLNFTRGKVEFDGAEKIDPILDFVTSSQVQTYNISISVGGRASFPKISLSSTPPLPEDEVLSQLLFEKSSGELSAFEALQLAQAAAELAGVDTGVGMLDAVRGATGLDQLSVDAGDGKTGPSVTAGRYVSEGVYVGVKQGTGVGSSVATVEVEVTPNIKLETELGADSSKAGVNWEWDY
jgi:translocation and assembly module TamB